MGKYKAPSQPNILLLGLTPHNYMLRALRSVRSSDLEQALLLLPFHSVQKLIPIVRDIAKKDLDVELCSKCAVFLIQCFQPQIVATKSLAAEIEELRDILTRSLDNFRCMIGTNV